MDAQLSVAKGDASLCSQDAEDLLVDRREGRLAAVVDGLDHAHNAPTAVTDGAAQDGVRAVAGRLVVRRVEARVRVRVWDVDDLTRGRRGAGDALTTDARAVGLALAATPVPAARAVPPTASYPHLPNRQENRLGSLSYHQLQFLARRILSTTPPRAHERQCQAG